MYRSSLEPKLLALLLAALSAFAPPLMSAPADDASGAVDDRAEREVVVGIHRSPPFVMQDHSGRWTGLAIELWELIAADNGIKYRYRPMHLDAMLEALSGGDIDFAVGAISLTAPREQHMDLSHPFLLSGLGIAVPQHDRSNILTVLGGLLSVDLLKVLGVVTGWLLLAGLLIWVFERRCNSAMFGGPPRKGIGSGFWWALVTLTTVGYGDKSPITLGGRVIATLWMIVALVMLSSLTAAITSAMTVSTLDSNIKGPADLAGKRVATVTASASADWLDRQGLGCTGYEQLDQALDAVADSLADAVVYDAPILSHLLKQPERHGLRLLEHRFQRHFYGFALARDSPYREGVNYQMLRHINSAQWTRLRRMFLGAEH
jgi:polar amino acid transport system substrate-binding protein